MSVTEFPVQAKLRAKDFVQILKERNYRFFAGVPCSYFKHAIDELADDPALTYVAAVNEGAALALCAGAATAGTKAACILQNSGFGNMVNPLTSLSRIYRIPTLIFISLRAYPDWTKDEPQHRVMGEVLTGLLDVLQVPFWTVPREPIAFAATLAEADRVVEAGGVAALLVEKDTVAGEERPTPVSDRPLSRMEAIRIIAEEAPPDAVTVSTTGMISRELFAAADRPKNFYMQGSMGHAVAMGLGLALGAPPGTPIVVLDGDGAALMHMGSMATVAERAPRRFLHVVLDNEAYGTTGNQMTASTVARLEAVAAACGYARVGRCDDAAGLRALVGELRATHGPTCLLVKVNRREVDKIPRITSRYTTEDTALRVRNAITQARQVAE
jgi:phosphonopyruvate decarboxylase